MSEWAVRSIGVHVGHISATAVTPQGVGEDLLEIHWNGHVEDHPKLKALLKQMVDYIAEHLPEFPAEKETKDG